MKWIQLLALIFAYFLLTDQTIAQADCDNSLALTPGTQQCGDSAGQAGSFPDDDSAPTNPCTSAYNDGEYWFEYTVQVDGERLDLVASGVTGILAGLFVFDNCPGSSPVCTAFDSNSGSSMADLIVSTPPLTAGTTYKIVIANEDFINSYSTAFCLDATLIPPTGCNITTIAAGSQSSCDPITNLYTQDIILTYDNPLMTGQIDVNGQLFAIGSSPQTVTLTGLNSNSNNVDVTAFFTDDIYCTISESALFTAPAACDLGSSCDTPVDLTPGIQQCGNSNGNEGSFPNDGSAPNNPCHVHYNDGEYWYTYTAQNTGEILELTLSGITGDWTGLFLLDDCPTSSPACLGSDGNTGNSTSDLQIVSPTLTAGTTYKIVIATWFTLSDNGTNFCLDATVYPPTNCSITSIAVGTQSACDPATDHYTQDLIVSYDNPPTSGQLEVNGQLFAIGTSPQTVMLTDLLSNGNEVDVEAIFTDDLTCSYEQTAVFTAAQPCKPGATCQVSVLITPGTQQCGNSDGNQGSFGPGFSATENPCENEFTDVEYWFEYMPSVSGEILELTLSGLTQDDVGLFVIDNCPDASPVCLAHDDNNNSMNDFIVTTPPLFEGITYKIVIARDDFFGDGGTAFCLDAIVQPPSGCVITSITAGTQTECDTMTGLYTQEVTLEYTLPPGSGQLNINGQLFSIATSPQTEALVGLNSDANPVDVAAFFTDDVFCALTVDSLFTAPDDCQYGSTCEISNQLTPGTQQCGDSGGQEGSFPDDGSAPTNPCSFHYNDGEYWFEYTAQVEEEQLDLVVSNISGLRAGVFVFDNCPSASLNCLASDVNAGSSTSNLLVTTPPLTMGTSYKIVIANDDLVGSYSTSFCIDATVIPPTGCEINSIAVGSQSACDPTTNEYTQDIILTYENPIPTGQINVNGQLFTIGSSPQTVTLTGLISNGNSVDVTAFFTDHIYCTKMEIDLFTAPDECIEGSNCENPVSLTPGTQQCGDSQQYSGSFPGNGSSPSNPCNSSYNDQEYWFTYTAQNTGEVLELSLTQISDSGAGLFVLDNCPQSTPTCIAFDANSGSSTSNLSVITPELTQGTSYKIVIATDYFSSNFGTSFCLDATIYPPSVCNITEITAGTQSSCDPISDEYSQDLIITFTDPPTTGELNVNDQNFTIGSSPQTITLTGLLSDGGSVDVNATFTDDLTCNYSQSSVFTAPESCIPGATCQEAVLITPGTQQCHDSEDNQGSFGTIFTGIDINPCNTAYTYGEFWFEYSPSVSGEILQLTVSSIEEYGVGLFVIDDCPDSSPSCLGQETNPASLDNLNVNTPPLYVGTTYKIIIALNSSSYNGTSFCLDAVVEPPSGCAITAINSGMQTPCDSVTGEYTQEITINYDLPPSTGQLDINGQLFTIGTSPQTEILTGLDSDGNPVDVTAFFPDDDFCSLTVNSAFTAPENCLSGTSCEDPMSLTPGTQQCGNSAGQSGSFPQGGGNPTNPCNTQWNADEFWYEYVPLETGEILELTLSNISNHDAGLFVFDNCPTSSPNCLGSDTNSGSQTGNLFVTTPSLTAEVSYKIAIVNRQLPPYNTAFCLDVIVHSPTDCEFTSITEGSQGACDPLNDEYTQDVIISFDLPPASGQIDVNGQLFDIGTSPQTVTLVGLISNGSSVDVTTQFTDDLTCFFTENDVFTAPQTCFPGASCASAITLSPGTQQCGNSQGQTGDFDGNGGSPINPCSPNYNEDEYWFEYVSQETDEILSLTLSGITKTYAGLFVIDGCTDLSPSCIDYDINYNSTADLSIATPPLTAGTTYKIVISSYGSYTGFCLDAIVYPPTDCVITSVVAGIQTACDTLTDLYTQEIIISYDEPPSSGQVDVNGQLFNIGTSPQTITLVGLQSNGLPVSISAFFTEDLTCSYSEDAFFTAPVSCIPGGSCGEAITLTPGTQQCGDSQGQPGSFPNNGSEPTNSCSSLFVGDEYWFEFSPQITGESLELTLSSIDAYNVGLFVFDDCPDGNPVCIASDVNFFSKTNLNLTTPTLNAGITYKIVITNWGGSTGFCIDGIVHPPPPCEISFTSTHTSCGEDNGIIESIETVVSGEVDYTLNGTMVVMPATNLSPGSYDLVATDESGCTISETLTISSSQSTDIIITSYIGPANGSWNVPFHWDDNRIPTGCSIVNILPGFTVFTDDNIDNYCKSLSISNGSQLNIGLNSTMNINN